MTAVLVDTNILLDIASNDPTWAPRSAAALAEAAEEATLVINPVVYAELSVGFAKIEDVDAFLGRDFRRDHLPWDAAFLAAKAFQLYRRRGGTKTSPLADFFIGAHAAVGKMEILTRDARRFERDFPTVKIRKP